MAKTKKTQTGAATETAAVIQPKREYALKFETRRRLTLPHWKWEDGVEKFFKILGEFRVSNQVAKVTKTGEATRKPATVCHVLNLETNMEAEIIVGAMLKSTLEEGYPSAKYVGKCFKAHQYKVAGKSWKGYAVEEIELS